MEGCRGRIVSKCPYPLKRTSFTPILKNFLIPLSFRMFFDFRLYYNTKHKLKAFSNKFSFFGCLK
ncbi:hypothetical protein EXS91_06575 [Helicobacter pylori]|nr:hypothetical protein [Helicobacter pylori]